MTCHDVFNGDADGLCALHQLRLAAPRNCNLVTGPKRDVRLLARVDAREGDSVTVLDISLDVNRAALDVLLARGVDVTWFDHHYAGDVPVHPRLAATIDTRAGRLHRDAGGPAPWRPLPGVGGRRRVRRQPARERRTARSRASRFPMPRLTQLRSLGEALAYAGCGEREEDLLIRPADLYAILHRYRDPLRFVAAEPVVRTLREGARADLAAARALAPAFARGRTEVYELPDAAWSRRVASLFANELANGEPARAHVVLTPGERDGWWVSVRAPLAAPHGADRLCRQFPQGGGRAAAAGINGLPASRLPEFLEALDAAFPGIAR